MRDRLVGRWRLQSWTAHSAGGGIVHPFGERVQGSLMYTPGGWMSVQIAAADRGGSPCDEQLDFPGAAEYPRYLAYCGTYRVEDGIVLHDVAMSLSPAWVGTRQVRRCELAGDVLVLRTVAAADGPGPGNELRWLREEAMSLDAPAPQYWVKGRDIW
jgi:hypothetical protein